MLTKHLLKILRLYRLRLATRSLYYLLVVETETPQPVPSASTQSGEEPLVTPSFIASAPTNWRLDVVEASANCLGLLEVRILMLRRDCHFFLGPRDVRTLIKYFVLPFIR